MATASIVFVGTYTSALSHGEGRAEGVHVFSLDGRTGELTPIAAASGVENPSYLAVDDRQRHLYAVQETAADRDPAVTAFAIDPDTHQLRFLSRQPAHGSLPCFVTLDPSGRFVLIANYGSGSVCLYPVLENGSLGPASDVVQHQGSSVNPERQEGPHAHAVVFDPGGDYLYVPELGLDRVMIYRLDPERGKLMAHDPAWTQVRTGAGPRHLAFHPSGRYAFLLNELDATVDLYAFDAGKLTLVQALSALPDGYSGPRSGAAIRVARDGRFVYTSNRGHDSIAMFAFDENGASLTLVGHQPTGGRTPARLRPGSGRHPAPGRQPGQRFHRELPGRSGDGNPRADGPRRRGAEPGLRGIAPATRQLKLEDRMDRPIIAITMGDPAGIGPELVVKLLAQSSTYHQCRPVVIGDPGVLHAASRLIPAELRFHRISELSETRFRLGQVELVTPTGMVIRQVPIGQVDAAMGEAAAACLRTALELAAREQVQGIVLGAAQQGGVPPGRLRSLR